MEPKWVWLAVSAGALVVGVSGVVVLWSLLDKIFKKDESAWRVLKRFWWIHFWEVMLCALVVFGLTGLLGESGVLSEFFKDQVADVFTGIYTDPKYMREHVSPEKIKEIRIVATEALCKVPVEKGPGTFLDLIDNEIYPTLDAPLREGLDVHYEQKIIDVHGGKALEIYNRISWTYRNLSTETILYPQEIQNTMEPVAGITPQGLFTVIKFTVDGETIDLGLKPQAMEDGRFLFKGSYDVRIEETKQVTLITKKIIPLTDHFTVWMNVPTKGVKLTYRHPANFKPRVYVFGMGDGGLKQIEETPERTVWEYDGWLLKKHGVLLNWVIEAK